MSLDMTVSKANWNTKKKSKAKSKSAKKDSSPIDFSALFKVYSGWIVLALLLIVVVAQWDKVVALVDHPVSTVELHGQFENIDMAALNQDLDYLVGSSFMAADLTEIKLHVESLAWVKSATVSRVWPGKFVIIIEEQKAVAYWGDSAYLNPEAEVFTPKVVTHFDALTQINAPVDMPLLQRKEILSETQQIGALFSAKSYGLSQVNVANRGAWELVVSSGALIALGDLPFEAELARALAVYDTLTPELQLQVKKIDARYPNGVAVAWHDRKLADTQLVSGLYK